MGHRHLLAYKVLQDTGIANLDLVALCDVRPESAALCAGEMQRVLGRTPMVFHDLDEVLAHPDIAAVDVVTDGSTHHEIAVPALKAGKHALVEKPLGITMRACRAMIDASVEGGALLATAENYRRDPPNRLVKAVIDAGILGKLHTMLQVSVGGNDEIAITPWRHLKVKGAIGLDMGAHYADIIRYYTGEFEQIFGSGFIVEPIRRRPEGYDDHPLVSYRERAKSYPDTVEATGEDSVVALYRMSSGVFVQLTMTSGRGGRTWERSVHGQLGSLYSDGDRSGKPIRLVLENHELVGRQILEVVPDFELNEITERLFGKRAVDYDMPTHETHPGYAIDARHLAIEYHDFGEAILHNRPPEVDGLGGMKAVAAVVGAYESAELGRAVSMDEMLSCSVDSYQREIDISLGIVDG